MCDAASYEQRENAEIADLSLLAGIVVEGIRQGQCERCERDDEGPCRKRLEVDVNGSAPDLGGDLGIQKEREERVCAERHILHEQLEHRNKDAYE